MNHSLPSSSQGQMPHQGSFDWGTGCQRILKVSPSSEIQEVSVHIDFMVDLSTQHDADLYHPKGAQKERKGYLDYSCDAVRVVAAMWMCLEPHGWAGRCLQLSSRKKERGVGGVNMYHGHIGEWMPGGWSEITACAKTSLLRFRSETKQEARRYLGWAGAKQTSQHTGIDRGFRLILPP